MDEQRTRASGAWELTFFVTAATTVCAGLDWLSVLTGSVLAALLCAAARHAGMKTWPMALRFLLLVWLTALLWVAGRCSAALFPDAANRIYVPAVVLALAWLLARRPRQAVLACCAVISLFVLAAVAVVLVFALPDVQLSWLRPDFSWHHALVAAAVGSGANLLRAAAPQTQVGMPWRAAAVLAPAAAAAVTCGCLSPELASGQTLAFYTLSRSISLFGVVERFEALVAACLCMGCCAAAALVLTAARNLLPAKWSGGARDGWTAAGCAVAALLPPLPLSGTFFSALTAILWVVLPCLTQAVVGCKKR